MSAVAVRWSQVGSNGATDTNKQRYILMDNVTRKTVFGRSVIIRKRVSKRKPIGYSSGSCFHKLDAGYWSLYVSLRKPQRKVGFGTITDK